MEVDELIETLLESIAAKRLVIFAGAGVSFANPSSVPSAAAVANRAYLEHQRLTGQTLPTECEWNLEKVAQHFYLRGRLTNYFLSRLVEWRKFRTSANRGHFAIADLLACGAIDFALTTNFDDLVERASERIGDRNFRAALDGKEARAQTEHRPYLKVYGCCARDSLNTLWCHEQTADSPLKERLQVSRDWLRANLLDRDLLVVGFWSDWAYLNDIFEAALPPQSGGHVYLVDPAEDEFLKTKAPVLWKWASDHHPFAHVRANADDVLEQLRFVFSKQLLKRVMASDRMNPFIDSLSSDDAYAIRRDLAGANAVARDADPDESMSAFARSHEQLIASGAQFSNGHYLVSGRSVRVVQAAGRLVSDVRAELDATPEMSADLDVLLCAGAVEDGGLEPNVMKTAADATIIRGSSSKLMLVTSAESILEGQAR